MRTEEGFVLVRWQGQNKLLIEVTELPVNTAASLRSGEAAVFPEEITL